MTKDVLDGSEFAEPSLIRLYSKVLEEGGDGEGLFGHLI